MLELADLASGRCVGSCCLISLSICACKWVRSMMMQMAKALAPFYGGHSLAPELQTSAARR
jgi:hypothetical protein